MLALHSRGTNVYIDACQHCLLTVYLVFSGRLLLPVLYMLLVNLIRCFLLPCAGHSILESTPEGGQGA